MWFEIICDYLSGAWIRRDYKFTFMRLISTWVVNVNHMTINFNQLSHNDDVSLCESCERGTATRLISTRVHKLWRISKRRITQLLSWGRVRIPNCTSLYRAALARVVGRFNPWYASIGYEPTRHASDRITTSSLINSELIEIETVKGLYQGCVNKDHFLIFNFIPNAYKSLDRLNETTIPSSRKNGNERQSMEGRLSLLVCLENITTNKQCQPKVKRYFMLQSSSQLFLSP